MSPTRRGRVTSPGSRLLIGATVLTALAGTAVVTRTVASADSAPGAAAAPCQPAPGAPAAPAPAAPAQAGAASAAAAAAKQPAQPLSPGARWLKRRGEMVDRHGVHNIWGDGQATPTPPAPAPSASAPAPSASAPAPEPSATQVPAPTGDATPSAAPSVDPSATPPVDPSADPSTAPSVDPSATPSVDQSPDPTASAPAGTPAPSPSCDPAATPSASPSSGTAAPPLDILGNSCASSQKAPHTGFQDGDRCVSTEFGEVGTADKNPSLLITSAPRSVRVNEFFDLKVSTRNLVRDRFLKAAQGGYYKESSFLTADGLVRGHFHTACRMLATTSEAPDPAPAPAFFVATEDGQGGAQPDTVTIRVLGMPQAGMAQCAVWAGDGSHRVPMMQRANQVPAFDVVRIRVR
jgi:hypothetical protein